MGFLRTPVERRFPVLGRVGDLVIVSNAGLRLAHRRGLVSDELAAKFGAADSSGGSAMSVTEMAIAAAALVRLTSRLRRRR